MIGIKLIVLGEGHNVAKRRAPLTGKSASPSGSAPSR